MPNSLFGLGYTLLHHCSKVNSFLRFPRSFSLDRNIDYTFLDIWLRLAFVYTRLREILQMSSLILYDITTNWTFDTTNNIIVARVIIVSFVILNFAIEVFEC